MSDNQGHNVIRPIYDEHEIAELPMPVQRYFRMALPNRQRIISTARVCHQGQFRIGGRTAGWKPFSSVESFGVQPPQLLWKARIRLFVGLSVTVVDSYRDGLGSMQATVLGFPVARFAGTAELASGALQRYVAESLWFPTALLPSQGVEWLPIDTNTAQATLRDRQTAVALQFHFNSAGEITSAYTSGRYRQAGKGFQLTPWTCRYSQYEERKRVRIPLQGEVEWKLPDGALEYWRGRITEIAFDEGF